MQFIESNTAFLLSLSLLVGFLLIAGTLQQLLTNLRKQTPGKTKRHWFVMTCCLGVVGITLLLWITSLISGKGLDFVAAYIAIIIVAGCTFAMHSVQIGIRSLRKASDADETRLFLSGVLQELGILMFIVDEQGRITMVNKQVEQQLGRREQSLIGQPVDEFFLSELPDPNSGLVEMGIILPGMRELPVQVSVNLFSLNEKTFLLIVAQDIREIKEQERQLKTYLTQIERSNKELEQFSYVAAHDLKAPLRAISNLATFIEEDLQEVPESVQKNIHMLKGRIQRMEGLVNGILSYARSGKIKVNPEMTDVKQMLEEIVDSLGARQNANVWIDEGMPKILTQKVLLEQVMANLISNACKYNNNPEPLIEIASREAGPFYEFSVKDNGQGIPLDSHKKIFQMFQTLQAKDHYESTGIGLSIVKKIVEEKGGRIEVVSAPGEGCTFKFTWPRLMN